MRSLTHALLAIRVLAVAALVPRLMRLDLVRLERVLEPRRPRRARPAPGEVEALARRVDGLLARGRPLVRPGCLTRGVTLFYVLRRAGAPVELVFGLGWPQGALEGHCWLVQDGEPFRERRDPRTVFAETYRIPRTASSRP